MSRVKLCYHISAAITGALVLLFPSTLRFDERLDLVSTAYACPVRCCKTGR